MKLKKGVKITNLTPQMVLAIRIVESVYQRMQPGHDVTITSIDEGQHGPGTLHGKGKAVDLRRTSTPYRTKSGALWEMTSMWF
jgi:hypothetical protein